MTIVTFACGHTLDIGLSPRGLAHKIRHLQTLDCHESQIWPLLHGDRPRADRAKAVRDRLIPGIMSALIEDPERCEIVAHFKCQRKASWWLTRRFWSLDRLISEARRSIAISREDQVLQPRANQARQPETIGAAA